MVSRDRAERGVAVCGTGIGIAIAANKVKGIRAGVPGDLFATILMREHNDANVIAFGARQTAAAASHPAWPAPTTMTS